MLLQANRMLARLGSFIMAANEDRVFNVLQTSRSRTIVKYTYLLVTLIVFLTSPLLASSKGELKRKQFRCVTGSIRNDSTVPICSGRCHSSTFLLFSQILNMSLVGAS